MTRWARGFPIRGQEKMLMQRFRITTPEQVYFHYEAAGLISRAMAWWMDQLFVWLARIAVVMVMATAGGYLAFVLILLGFFLLDFGYYLFFEIYWAGQSPGKRMFRIRVVSSRGGKLRFADVFIRNLMRPLDTLPLFMTLGGLVAFFDPLHRRIGDFAAETMVVRDLHVRLPETLLAQRARVNSFEEDPVLRSRIFARVTRDERDLMLDLMLRRDDLDPGTREDIFSQAAAYFRQRYALPEDLEHLSDEQTVINLALMNQRSWFMA